MQLLAHLQVQERSQTSEVRRIATQFAHRIGFGEEDAGRVALVATEAANNLVKHARGGEILLSTTKKREGLRLVALDRGPGMNLEACLEDGFSTSGTPGTGLGAIRRMSDTFDAYSGPTGTVLAATFGAASEDYGAASVPIKGETACGDAWSIVTRGGATWVLVADGLGHGEFAAAAAQQAVAVFESNQGDSAAAMVEEVHEGLRSTRGAAVAVAEIRGSNVNYCGLGNIAGILYSRVASVHMVSLNGTAGVEARKFSQFSYVWKPGAMLILHSDGLQSQWSLEQYPSLLRHSPSVIAGVLYRDYARGRDDVTVVVVRQ